MPRVGRGRAVAHPVRPGAVTGVTARAVAPLEARIAWTGTDHATVWHEVDRRQGAGAWYLVGIAPPHSFQFWDWGRAANTAYDYRVRGVTAAETGAWSATASVTTMNEDGSGEFVGPFPSWKNVKTDYGAVGNGVADDTTAFQNALTALMSHSESNVLWIPAGTYRITQTLETTRGVGADGLGMSVIGADPATTTILWDGDDGDDILHWDAWYSKISRLTFDGNEKADICLRYGLTFSTYNEISDCWFVDCGTGIACGIDGGNGQAEELVLRCRFTRCADYGLVTRNFNSLDEWLWYCRFADCGIGVYNAAGGFHVYHCLFERSTVADVGAEHLQVFSFVNNVSIGSAVFLGWHLAAGHTWGSALTVHGNRVVEASGDWSMRLGSAGPFLLMDNVVRQRAAAAAPEVQLNVGDTALVGNVYGVSGAAPASSGRLVRLDEQVVDRTRLDPDAPALPGTPTNHGRTIHEVTAGATGAATQTVIDTAVAAGGTRRVVHLPKGSYSWSTGITIPAGSDLQLIGDGPMATQLTWTGAAGGTMITCAGPVKATLAEFSFVAGVANGIRLTAADQADGSVWGTMVSLDGAGTGTYVNGVESSDVTFLAAQGNGGSAIWIRVTGGATAGAGQVGVFTGATSANTRQYQVDGGGRLLVRALYHESGVGRALFLTDEGTLLSDATRYSYELDSTVPLIALDGFAGRLTLTTCFIVCISGTGWPVLAMLGDGSDSDVLALCLQVFGQFPTVPATTEMWQDTADPAATTLLLLPSMNTSSPPTRAFAAGVGSREDEFIRRHLLPLRQSRIPLPGTTGVGVTGAILRRILGSVGSERVGLEIRAS